MDWNKGEPVKSGYYLVAWRVNETRIIVSELWFNSEARHHWWFTRGYIHQLHGDRDRDILKQELVVGWMPMPEPPKD